MAKRLVDVVLAGVALLATAPVGLVVAGAIWVEDRLPVFFRSRRAGLEGAPFQIIKFRTMRRESRGGSLITASGDSRVTGVGRFLRVSKIDELPQLINILRGEMSVVGPRPEDVDIVAKYYTPGQRETLRARPGLASPGSLYNYTHGEAMLIGPDSEASYLEAVLPVKLALDRVYVNKANGFYDALIIWRTIRIISLKLMGRTNFPDPPELPEARLYIEPVLPQPSGD